MSGLTLLEEALHLLRRDLATYLSSYFVATAPFIAGFLYFWSEMSSGVGVESDLMPLSLGLVFLWIWMVTGHALFCRRLWADIAHQPLRRLKFREIVRLAAWQTALQGPACIGLPVAASLALPFAWALAYFQNCHVFIADHPLSEAAARARTQAALWPKQNWELILAISFIGAVVFINVMLACVFGAQLLSSFFGITTALTRSQSALLSPTLMAVAAAITFVAVDPLLKAAYVLRCFQGESLHSGADLRLILRRAAMAMLIVLAFQSPAPAADYDRAIDQVLERPEYRWRTPAKRQEEKSAAEEYLKTVVRWLDRAITAFADFIRKLSPEQPESDQKLGSPTAVRAWMVVVSVLIVAAIGFAAWRHWKPRKAAVAESSPVTRAPIDIADESITPDQLPEDEWLKLADNLLHQGERRLAARALFLGALAQLHREGHITLTRHKTNLEYDRELARRTRSLPQIRPAFRELSGVFERTWYGAMPVDDGIISKMREVLPALRSGA